MKHLSARLAVVGLLAVGLSPLMGGTSWAACSSEPTAADRSFYSSAARNAALIYQGKVIGKTESEDGLKYFYDISVSEELKGNVSSPQFVESNKTGGLNLTMNVTVLVVDTEGDGKVVQGDGTTQSSVCQRAQVVRETLHPSPTPKPTPSKTKPATPKPTPKPSASKAASASPSPSPSPIPVLPSIAPTTASPAPSVAPTSAAPSPSESNLDLAADGDEGMPLIQIVVAGALAVLALVGGVVLFRVTRPVD